MSIADPQAGWPQEIAQTVLTLGKQNTLFMSQCPDWLCRARVHCKWQAPHCSKSSQDGYNHRTHCCHGGTSTSVTTCSSSKGVHGDYSCTFTSYSPSDDSVVQVCLVETRGHNRFSPCRHAVCCQDCAAMIHARGDGCIICRNNIDAVEQGEHLHLCECLVVH